MLRATDAPSVTQLALQKKVVRRRRTKMSSKVKAIQGLATINVCVFEAVNGRLTFTLNNTYSVSDSAQLWSAMELLTKKKKENEI